MKGIFEFVLEEPTRECPDACEVCGCNGGAIIPDWDPKTDKFRGWLCCRCDHAFEKLGDNAVAKLQARRKELKNAAA